MPSPITTKDLQKRYDENAVIRALVDKYHNPHERSFGSRECITCLKRAIYEVDKDDRVYRDHWGEWPGIKITDTIDGGMIIEQTAP